MESNCEIGWLFAEFAVNANNKRNWGKQSWSCDSVGKNKNDTIWIHMFNIVIIEI